MAKLSLHNVVVRLVIFLLDRQKIIFLYCPHLSSPIMSPKVDCIRVCPRSQPKAPHFRYFMHFFDEI